MLVTLEVSKLSGWLNADAPENMPYMFVTLEASKLSGWLNADATENMPYMVVTLEVSKLSGCLNADACCRESKEGHAVRGARYTGRGAAGGGRPRRTQRAGEGAAADWGQGTGKSART